MRSCKWIWIVCGLYLLVTSVALAAPYDPKTPPRLPQQKMPQQRKPAKRMIWPKIVQKCGNKVPGFNVLAGYTVVGPTGKLLNAVSCNSNQVCVEPIAGKATCAGPGHPQFSQRCWINSAQFTYSDPTYKKVDTWKVACDAGTKCVAPPDELAKCVEPEKVQVSCQNPNAVHYSYGSSPN